MLHSSPPGTQFVEVSSSQSSRRGGRDDFKEFGIYAHFSDLELGTWDGQPIPQNYTMLEVTFSSLSSSQWVQEAHHGFHICGLTLGYGPEVEPLNLHEEVHMAM